jgi:hypothetical protein
MQVKLVEINGKTYYATGKGIKVSSRGKVTLVQTVFGSLPKGERRKLRKALRAAGDPRCALPAWA